MADPPPLIPAERGSLLLWMGLLDYALLVYDLHCQPPRVDKEKAARQLMEHARRSGIRWDGDGR